MQNLRRAPFAMFAGHPPVRFAFLSAFVLVVAYVSTLLGQDATITVVEASYTKTKWSAKDAQAPRVTESGTYLIAPDGRFRIERVVDGKRTVEISNPLNNSRIVLDYDAREAVVAPFSFSVGTVTSSGPDPTLHISPVPVTETRTDSQPLGTRNVGDFQL